jgi:hypothetical protein
MVSCSAGGRQDGYNMSEDEAAEELEEVTQELKAKEERLAQQEGGLPCVLAPIALA